MQKTILGFKRNVDDIASFDADDDLEIDAFEDSERDTNVQRVITNTVKLIAYLSKGRAGD